jgi:hypothetical protein
VHALVQCIVRSHETDPPGLPPPDDTRYASHDRQKGRSRNKTLRCRRLLLCVTIFSEGYWRDDHENSAHRVGYRPVRRNGLLPLWHPPHRWIFRSRQIWRHLAGWRVVAIWALLDRGPVEHGGWSLVVAARSVTLIARLDHALPNALRSSVLARSRMLRCRSGRLLPARLM